MTLNCNPPKIYNMKLHSSSMWRELKYLSIISTIFSLHLHWSILYDYVSWFISGRVGPIGPNRFEPAQLNWIGRDHQVGCTGWPVRRWVAWVRACVLACEQNAQTSISNWLRIASGLGTSFLWQMWVLVSLRCLLPSTMAIPSSFLNRQAALISPFSILAWSRWGMGQRSFTAYPLYVSSTSSVRRCTCVFHFFPPLDR